jgi:hypothetical protein
MDDDVDETKKQDTGDVANDGALHENRQPQPAQFFAESATRLVLLLT